MVDQLQPNTPFAPERLLLGDRRLQVIAELAPLAQLPAHCGAVRTSTITAGEGPWTPQ